MNIKTRFGLAVKIIRSRKGISQEKLAGIAGIDRTYMTSIEKGNRNVSLVVAEKIAKALKVGLADLI